MKNLLCTLLLIITIPKLQSATSIPIYKDVTASIDSRVEDLLSRMTLREKVIQLQNNSTNNPADFKRYYGSEGVGSWHDMSLQAHDCATVIDSLQRYLKTQTRLGIPALTSAEGVQGVIQNGCTLYPTSLAVGSTFNRQLMYDMASATAREARAMGISQFLSPVLDLARELRWGRVEELYGEDPYLVGEMATNFINGAWDNGVGSMPKHFIGYGSPTGGLNGASCSGGDNDLRNIYAYPFKKVIDNANPTAIMSSYNAYDGMPVTGSRYLLTDVLRGELGFDGFIYSDWGSISRLGSQHHIVGNEREAAKLAIMAGMDMACADGSFQNLENLVESGELPVSYVDEACRRILRGKFILGLFDNAAPDLENLDGIIHSPKHVELARQLAVESTILLKNNGILPLDTEKYKSIAVLGPNSDYGPVGDYSWASPGEKVCTSLYEGLRAELPESIKLMQADGCDWWSRDTTQIADAIRTAREADLTIVAVGTRSYWLGRNAPAGIPTTGEGFDLSELDLPGAQLELLKAVKSIGKPLIVVLITGKPLIMNWANENADAVLTQFYCGEQQGTALAQLLSGKENPSGRLNVSFPRSTGNTPCFYNYLPADRIVWNEQTGSPAEVGGHHVADSPGTPEKPGGRYVYDTPYALWPFGYGLSYTTFEISEPEFEKTCFTSPSDTIRFTVNVTNTGLRDGKEVVQIYISDKIATISVPIHQLKGFEKIEVKAGEARPMQFEIPVKELALWTRDHGWLVEPGEFEVRVARSSDAILHRQIIVYQPK